MSAKLRVCCLVFPLNVVHAGLASFSTPARAPADSVCPVAAVEAFLESKGISCDPKSNSYASELLETVRGCSGLQLGPMGCFSQYLINISVLLFHFVRSFATSRDFNLLFGGQIGASGAVTMRSLLVVPSSKNVVLRALMGTLALPDFNGFATHVRSMYQQAASE